MKRHLTDASVQRLKPPRDKDLEVFDLGYPGLALRVGYGGAKSFILFYRYAGKLRRQTLGRWPEVSLGAARERWRRTREAVARGDDPLGANGKVPALAFEAVVEEWLRRDVVPRCRASSAYRVQRLVEHDLLPAWQGRRIDTIVKHDVLMLLDAIVDRGAPAKARRVYVHAHRLFKWCAGRGIVSVSPMAGIEAPGRESSRERVLTDTELAAVWQASTDWPFGAIVRLLVLTGARREEIGQLIWDEIQGDTIVLEGSRTKNGNGHLIPLSSPALELLRSAPRIGEKYVFTLDGIKPVSSWSRAKARLDKASGVAGWRIHDLRRTVATGMQRLGVGLQTVEALLGHTGGSRAGIVGVYQRHDFAAEKRVAVEAWGAHVMTLVRQ